MYQRQGMIQRTNIAQREDVYIYIYKTFTWRNMTLNLKIINYNRNQNKILV